VNYVLTTQLLHTHNMTNKITKTMAGLAALVGLSAVGQAIAGDNGLGVTTRYRVEDTRNTEANSRLMKTTFGLATSPAGENFRVYNYDSSAKGGDYTAVAYNSPELKLGGTKTNVLGFGTFGDREGIGLETKTSVDDSTFYINLEKAQADGKDSTRIGASLDQKIGNLTLGAGFDQITTASGTTNYFLGRAILDVSKKDQVGAAVRVARSDTVNTNSIILDGCHYGANENWGSRAWLRLDDSDNGTRTISGEVIGTIGTSSTFSKYSSPWITSNHQIDGGMFGGVVENALGGERTPLGDRIGKDGGLAGAICWSVTEGKNEPTGFIKGEAGYKIKITDNTSVTPTVFGRNDIGTGDNTLGGSVLLRTNTKIGSFALEATADDDANIYGSMTYSVSF